MTENRLRSEERGAAGWDGVDRRTRPVVRRGWWVAWRSPERMGGAVLASAGATWLVQGVAFVVEHLHITVFWR
ncbi:hypothetical protein [Streptomyces sp. CB01881]|uniref:hypothetical protein n=1 Tax=Streptomyces sp. CB01881 TaxID=2078691 RepID=UPI000CDBAE44|nr:hypothetical protein [Streptomyces sp. CB01881]AUY48314.1 hypothetical protein C2142_04315 [Streptomyces sp. CB01881]TYC76801.1 hypothetical protein EH183_04325 [Streptomyces sp. CB01881]